MERADRLFPNKLVAFLGALLEPKAKLRSGRPTVKWADYREGNGSRIYAISLSFSSQQDDFTSVYLPSVRPSSVIN